MFSLMSSYVNFTSEAFTAFSALKGFLSFVRQPMPGQTQSVNETLPTFRTGIRFLSSVYSIVRFQIRHSRETLATLAAYTARLPSVDFLMNLQIIYHTKTLSALAALVGFLSRVSLTVSFQVRRPPKCLLTYSTFISLLFGMHQSLVMHTIGCLCKYFPTYCAFMHRVISVLLLMSVKKLFFAKALSAFITFKWLLSFWFNHTSWFNATLV